jgi:uncharacterized repeat protein (TIGR01451 family)
MSRQVERPPRRWRARAVGALIGSALLLGMTSAAMADHGTPEGPPPPPTQSGDGVVPVLVPFDSPSQGNPTCSDLGYTYGFKVDSGALGLLDGNTEIPLDGSAQDTILENPTPPISGQSITGTLTDGKYLDWTSTFPVSAVIMKASNAANVFEYDPADTGDTHLFGPLNGHVPHDLSHVTFCFEPFSTVVVKKRLANNVGDENFTFTMTEEGTPVWTSDPLGISNPKDSTNVTPMTEYFLTEDALPEGYEWLGLKCWLSSPIQNDNVGVLPPDQGSFYVLPGEPTVKFKLEPFQKITCIFKNAQTPKLIVDKVVTGGEGDTTKFDFTLTGEFPMPVIEEPKASDLPVIDPVAFQLANGEDISLPLRAPECLLNGVGLDSLQTEGSYCPPISAQYELTELPVPEGYQFVDLVCSREDPWLREREESQYLDASYLKIPEEGIEPKIDGPVATFGYVDYGTVVRCTYTNLKLPKLTVTKVLTNGSGAGLTQAFPFSITGQTDFTLTGGQSNGPRILPVGEYTVAEGEVPAGFTFTSASCTNTGNVPTGTPDSATRSVALNLAAGDDVTCTFINNQTPPPVTPEPPPAVVTQVLNPRLAIAKTGPLRARALQRLTYTIRVRNPGRAVARNVVVTDLLPSGLIFVKASRKATVKGRTITIPMGNLQPRQARTVKVTVRATATVRGRKVNLAVARATNVRPVRDTAPTVFTPLVRRVVPAVTG